MKPPKLPRVGDEAFEVEWCSDLPRNEYGDADMDRAVMHIRTFKTKGAAMRYARQVYHRDAFGSVSITPVRFMPYDADDAARLPTIGFWDSCGHTEHYEGEDGQ